LKSNMREARSYKFAVAFLRRTGYTEIEQDLEGSLERGHAAELVVGLSGYGITDWESLRELLRLRGKHGNLRVKYYYNEGFHPKLFIFEFPQNLKRIVLGSSNLTGGGIGENVEANILLQGTSSEKAIADILEFFENTCFLPAEELSQEIVNKYRLISESSRRKRKSEKSFIKETPLGKPTTSREKKIAKARKKRRSSTETRLKMFMLSDKLVRQASPKLKYSDVVRKLNRAFPRSTNKNCQWFVWATQRLMTGKKTHDGKLPNWFMYLARLAEVRKRYPRKPFAEIQRIANEQKAQIVAK